MKIVMQGKEQDIHLAETLREAFIERYNNEIAFQELIDGLGQNCSDRLIHRLKTEETIDLFKDYVVLKRIAEHVRKHNNREIFIEVCKVDQARTWINDNGKYNTLAFEAIYRTFRKNEDLQPLIMPKSSRRR